MIHRADLKFVIGERPTWTDAEITDVYWRILEALMFLNQHGVQFHQICLQEPAKQMMEAGWDKLDWLEAFKAARALERPADCITLYLVLRPKNWFREGMAGGIPADFVMLGYRAQMAERWSSFTAMAAHEILHALGASDEYADGSVAAACIMADLAQEHICDATRREVRSGG